MDLEQNVEASRDQQSNQNRAGHSDHQTDTRERVRHREQSGPDHAFDQSRQRFEVAGKDRCTRILRIREYYVLRGQKFSRIFLSVLENSQSFII